MARITRPDSSTCGRTEVPVRRLVLVHLLGCGVLPAPAAAQAPAATEADTRSLFDPRANQMQIGGRFSSIDGDPARFQRYQDLRDGVLFTDARFARSDAAGRWFFNAGADNVGYRDQRYSLDYERTGKFKVSGLWDEIPQFYSVDT